MQTGLGTQCECTVGGCHVPELCHLCVRLPDCSTLNVAPKAPWCRVPPVASLTLYWCCRSVPQRLLPAVKVPDNHETAAMKAVDALILCTVLLAACQQAAALSYEVCNSYGAEWVTGSPHLEGQYPFYSLIFTCECAALPLPAL